jgi:GTPase SAR1 family protein
MGYEEALRRINEAAETGVTELNLSRQELTELPSELFQLKDLTTLILNTNQLAELPTEIFQLTKLTELDLSDNELRTLSPHIGRLTNLTELSLGGNGLFSLPQEIVRLTNLTYLYLGANQLSTLPPHLFRLQKLTSLGLGDLHLLSLPPEIFQLSNLTNLDLSFNHLSALPNEIVRLTKLKRLNLYANPLISPPLELAVRGMDTICEYLTSAQEGTQTVAEVKVILVGEGASGKTSLTRCLMGEDFNKNEQTTHGIRIKPWQPDTGEQQPRCNLWDFGGQEIMHATHQFFLSRRSLYVLVLDGRQDNKAEYWLRYIESFGGGSPVLVVLNKYDTNPGFDLDRPFLEEKYPFIVGFYRTSCATNNGIRAFKQALLEELAKVPLTRNEWPLSWFRAKAELEGMHEPRISYEAFEGVCREAGVAGEISREVLGDFLHDLGIVIHFTDFGLDDNHVLDPKWVTGAVYKIINAESVAAGKGVLRLDALKQVLRPQKNDPYIYRRADHRYIIELMKKFELCYELEGGEVLIPQLLAVPRPSFDFPYEGALRFVLHYADFLPPSVMPRFIVKRHQEIKDRLRWRTGVVLEHPLLEATAVVRADNEARRIHIAVTGKERKIFLALIWLTFRELHIDFEGLRVSERVPLPDAPAVSVAYETLLDYAEQGLEKIIPEGTKKAYSVHELLEGVHFDNPSDGERMLTLVNTENKGGMRWVAEKLNRYFEVKGLELFGVKFKHNAVIDDLLNKGEK